MFTKKFWKDVAERAVKTAGQSLLAILGAAGVSLLTVSWPGVLAAVALATLLSVLSSIVTNLGSKTDTASVVVDTTEK